MAILGRSYSSTSHAPMRQLPSESFRFITRNCNGTEKVAVNCHASNFSRKLKDAEASFFEEDFAPDHRSDQGGMRISVPRLLRLGKGV